MASSSFNINDTFNIDNLFENIKLSKSWHCKIGILSGSNNSRTDGKTNAEVGNYAEKMEMGDRSGKVPRRSFLVDPLTIWGRESIEIFLKQNAANIMQGLLEEKGIKKLLNKLGFYAKKVINDAFESSGFGNWQPLAKSTIKKKGNDKILVDTEQLKNAIEFRVEK
jgi:hypothetical protein